MTYYREGGSEVTLPPVGDTGWRPRDALKDEWPTVRILVVSLCQEDKTGPVSGVATSPPKSKVPWLHYVII
jgi:hypothetical protein